MTPLFTSALERYPARRLATNRGSGRPPERVAPVVDNADNGHDDSADGIPAQISTGSHRGAAPCVPPFERIRRPLPNGIGRGKNRVGPASGRCSESVRRRFPVEAVIPRQVQTLFRAR